MKNKFLKTVLIGGLALTGFVSVALVNVEAASVYDEYSQSIYQPLSTETNLSVEEMLNYAINDEYMALSEYKAIVEEFGDVMPFVRIISAEETHISTLLNLFVTYGYNVPEDQTQNYVVIPESITAAVATAIEAEEANIEEPAILININNLYQRDMSEKEIYDATRKSWKVSISHVSDIKIACSVYRGIIREVFTINRWLPSPEVKGRYMFEGKVAQKNVREKYINKSISKYWKKGSRNPIKYVAP